MTEGEDTIPIPGTGQRGEKTIFEVNREQAQRLYAELKPGGPSIAGRVDVLLKQDWNVYAEAMRELTAIAVSFPKMRLNELAYAAFFHQIPYQDFVGGGKRMRAFFLEGNIPEAPQHRILGAILGEKTSGNCLFVGTAVTKSGDISTFYRRYHGPYPGDVDKEIDSGKWDPHYELKSVPWEGPHVSSNIENLFKILDAQAEAPSPA